MQNPSEASGIRTGAVLLFAYVLGSTVVGRSFTALAPSPWDGQLFAYMGLEWLHGRIPYTDIWELKPPGLFALLALVFSVFPKSFVPLAFVEGIFILGCVATVFRLMQRIGAPPAAVALATASAAVSTNLLFYNQRGTYTEIYLLWPAAMSMYCFIRGVAKYESRWLVLAGFFSGVAALFKTVGFAPWLAQCTYVFLLAVVLRRISVRQMLGSVLWSGVGAAAAWMPFAVYFGSRGALGDMLDASLFYPIQYGQGNQGSPMFTATLLLTNLQPVGSLVACLGAGLVVYRQAWTKSADGNPSPGSAHGVNFSLWPLIVLWVFYDVCGALAGGRGYPHYFLCLTPSLSVAAGFTFWFVAEEHSNGARSQNVRTALFGVILGPLILAQVLDFGEMLRLTIRAGSPPSPPWKIVAERLNAARTPSDTLFVWDYQPGIYFATEMRSPTRQLFAFRMFDSAAAHERFGEEIMRELNQAPPTFVVDGTKQSNSHVRGDPVYKRFLELLERSYTLNDQVDNFRVYKRRVDANLPSDSNAK